MKNLKQKILKTIRLFVGFFLLPLLFCRCNMFLHKTTDAEEYIRKNISKNQFVISDGKIIDDVKYWQVHFVDKPEFTFTVFSGLYAKAGALIPEGYRIFTNFDNVFAKYYLIEYKKEHNSKIVFEVNPFNNYKYEEYQFNGYYSSTEEAHLLAQDIESFWNYINEQLYPCKITIECHYRVFIDGAERGYRIYIESQGNSRTPNLQFNDEYVLNPVNKEMIEKKLLENIDNFNNAYKEYVERGTK